MTVTADQIGTIVDAMRRAGAGAMEASGPGWSLRITLPIEQPAPTPALAPAPAPITVTAPCAGSFLRGHPMRAAPLANEGDAVTAGDILALIAIGPLYRPVVSPGSGRLGHCMVEPGDPVGFGATLFHIHPAGPR